VIKRPSLQNEWTHIYSGDPSLLLPEGDEERARALKDARDRGDWSKLIDPAGDPPTLFHLGQVSRTLRDWILGEVSHSSALGRPLHSAEMDVLVVRSALRNVDGFGPHKVERQRHPSGHWLATTKIIDAIHDEAGPDVIPELAEVIWERATRPIRPL
jgi:hypothetical protein